MSRRSTVSMRWIKAQRLAVKLSMCGYPLSTEEILNKMPTNEELNYYYRWCVQGGRK